MAMRLSCSLYRNICRSKSTRSPVRYYSSPIPPKSRNPITRALYFLRNDPFARVSIMFGGTVLVVLLIVESFVPKPQKRLKPHATILPPRVTHPVIIRQELETLSSWIPSFYSLGPLVAMVTGPSGCGKTELVHQFANKFIELCSSWLPAKPNKRPIVLYIDAASQQSLLYSTNACAHVLGIMAQDVSSDSITNTLDSILSKLTEQKGKWLIIIDSVDKDVAPIISNSLRQLSGYKYRKGMVLVTSTQHPDMNVSTNRTLSLPATLKTDESLNLFSRVSGISVSELQSSGPCYNEMSPLGVVLSALTVRVYNHFYQSESLALSKYTELLTNQSDQPHPFNRRMHLYMEALSACDDNFVHSIDLIGSCDRHYPIPLSVLRQHLKNPFYRSRIPPNQSSPLFVTNDNNVPLEPRPNTTNYLSVIKNNLPLMRGSTPQVDMTQQMQQKEVDTLDSLLMSPFIRVSDLVPYDIKLLHVHPSASDYIRNNFVSFTISHLEEVELIRAKATWDRTTWFKRFRTYDPNNSLSSFLSSLPGVKDGGAYTQEQYNQQGTSLVSYREYIHAVSHYHRIAQTVSKELRYLGKDNEDSLMKKYLLPHIEYIISTHQHRLTDKDALCFETALVNVHSVLSNASYESLLQQYESLLTAHVSTHGQQHILTANILTSLGELYYHKADYDKAFNVLKQAINIHEGIIPRLKTQECSVDHASSLSLLGLVYAGIGNKRLCVKYLEQSMVMYQSIPSDGDITKSQRKVVATTITDLGHAYVMLGDVISAKKYLDLAIIAQRGIHGDVHPEVVRTLNVQTIVYTLMGDNSESRHLGKEAGEIQKELSLISNVI